MAVHGNDGYIGTIHLFLQSFSGVDFPLKKHSHQRSGLVDTVLRVRSASVVKMISAGPRQERHKVFSHVDFFESLCLNLTSHIYSIYMVLCCLIILGKFSKEN